MARHLNLVFKIKACIGNQRWESLPREGCQESGHWWVPGGGRKVVRREEGERGTQAAPACRGQAGKEHGIGKQRSQREEGATRGTAEWPWDVEAENRHWGSGLTEKWCQRSASWRLNRWRAEEARHSMQSFLEEPTEKGDRLSGGQPGTLGKARAFFCLLKIREQNLLIHWGK